VRLRTCNNRYNNTEGEVHLLDLQGGYRHAVEEAREVLLQQQRAAATHLATCEKHGWRSVRADDAGGADARSKQWQIRGKLREQPR
jgi:hypothetical protein